MFLSHLSGLRWFSLIFLYRCWQISRIYTCRSLSQVLWSVQVYIQATGFCYALLLFNALNLCCNSPFCAGLLVLCWIFPPPKCLAVSGLALVSSGYFYFLQFLLFAYGTVVWVHWVLPYKLEFISVVDAVSWSEKFKQYAWSFRKLYHNIIDFWAIILFTGMQKTPCLLNTSYRQLETVCILTGLDYYSYHSYWEKQITSLSL